jgi:hypothetical protein
MHDELKNKYSLPWRFKKAWIKALKSGDYIQGTGALMHEEKVYKDDGITLTGDYITSYCCLGVACAVAGVPEDEIDGEFIDDWRIKYESVPDVLQGVAEDNELAKVLSNMNDNCSNDEDRHRFSFTDIADWIDHNIKATR